MEDSEGYQDSEMEEHFAQKANSSSVTTTLAADQDTADQDRNEESFTVKEKKNLLETFIVTALSVRTVTAAIRSILSSGNGKDESRIQKLIIINSELDEVLSNFLVRDRDMDGNKETTDRQSNTTAEQQRCLFTRRGLIMCGQYLCVSIIDARLSTDDHNGTGATNNASSNKSDSIEVSKGNYQASSRGGKRSFSLMKDLSDMINTDTSSTSSSIIGSTTLSMNLSKENETILIVSLLSKLFHATALLDPKVSTFIMEHDKK